MHQCEASDRCYQPASWSAWHQVFLCAKHEATYDPDEAEEERRASVPLLTAKRAATLGYGFDGQAVYPLPNGVTVPRG